MTAMNTLRQSLAGAGFTLASPRNNSAEHMVQYGRPAMRIYCRAECPGDWRLCQRGTAGADGFCAHTCGDTCAHPDAVALLPTTWAAAGGT